MSISCDLARAIICTMHYSLSIPTSVALIAPPWHAEPYYNGLSGVVSCEFGYGVLNWPATIEHN